MKMSCALKHQGRFASLLFVILLLCVLFSPLQAEVMDKEPSIAQNWVNAAAFSLAALLAWRYRWWAGACVSGFFIATLFAVWSELRDPFVGPAINGEAESGYTRHFYSSAALGLAVHLAAAIYGMRKGRRSRSLP